MARTFALVATEDHWLRAGFDGTVLEPLTGAVELAWKAEPDRELAQEPVLPGAGLAFDPWCRLFHSRPEENQVERLLWEDVVAIATRGVERKALPVFAEPDEPGPGEFRPDAVQGSPQSPRGLAVDGSGRLYVAEAGERRVLVHDLLARRLLARLSMGAVPVDVSACGRSVHVVTENPAKLAVIRSRDLLSIDALPDPIAPPLRIAACPAGEPLVLTRAGKADASLYWLPRMMDRIYPVRETSVPFATDLEVVESEGATLLVVARRAGQTFRRFVLATGRRVGSRLAETSPLRARGYDGRGIVATPDGLVGYWSDAGFRLAAPARRMYRKTGRVTTFRLDSGRFQTNWGRVFVDACLPRGADLRVACVAADEPPEGATVPRNPPPGWDLLTEHPVLAPPLPPKALAHPEKSPPMPPESLAPGEGEVSGLLHRRATGCELPWVHPEEDDSFATYEAPANTGPGRYLWVVLELRGDSRSTPRVRRVRVEYPGHELLDRLPQVYSREERSADFLRRYLAMFDGMLGDLDSRATARHALLRPASAPAEILPWLAEFLGLVLSERWPLEAKRLLIEKATTLFRTRGTVPGLKAYLELFLGRDVLLIEHFRVRGLGGAVVGGGPGLSSSAVLGAGFRVGGAVGVEGEVVVGGESVPADAYETHAHLFTVIVPESLSGERLDEVRHILDVHRPAHTKVMGVCTVDAGMRVGIGLYAGLATVVGRTSGFRTLQVEGSLLGRDAVIGHPVPGTRPGTGRLGEDSRIG